MFKPPPSVAGLFRSKVEEWSESGTPQSLIFAIVSQKAAQIIKKRNLVCNLMYTIIHYIWRNDKKHRLQ